jgi:hypothetical protein
MGVAAMSQKDQPVTREDLAAFEARILDAIRTVVQETVPGIVREVIQETLPAMIRETVPGIVREVIQETVPAMIRETVPGIVREVIQETVPAMIREVIQETVPAMIQEMETRLLSSFFLYQEQAEVKYRKLSADVTNVNAAAELRLGNLESRVMELEKRVMMGGPRQ